MVIAATAVHHSSNKANSTGGGFIGGLWGSSSGPSVSKSSGAEMVAPLPFQRWDLPRSVRSCNDAVCLGLAPTDLYSALQGVSKGRRRLLYCLGEIYVLPW